MTDDPNYVRNATRGFRRRVANGHATARRRYLTPELREEAEMLRQMIDKLYAKVTPHKVSVRVKRIRQGATVEQSRSRRWKTLTHDDE